MIKDVTDLIVYRNALLLLRPIYKLASLLPRNEQKLRIQLTGAAKSIAPLITEGFAKRQSTKEFKRYLRMALGSSDEVITHLREIKIIDFRIIKPETCDALINRYKIVSKQLNRLIKEWRNFKSD